MADIATMRANARNTPEYRQTERHSRMFGRAAISASGENWKREEALRFLRQAETEWQIKEGLARLAALNAAYAEVRL